MLTMYHLAETY